MSTQSQQPLTDGDIAANRIRQGQFTLEDAEIWLKWEGRASAGDVMAALAYQLLAWAKQLMNERNKARAELSETEVAVKILREERDAARAEIEEARSIISRYHRLHAPTLIESAEDAENGKDVWEINTSPKLFDRASAYIEKYIEPKS